MWVAHPGLVPVALQAFDKHMPTPNQIFRQRDDVKVTAAELVAVKSELTPEFEPPTWVVSPPVTTSVGLPST